MAGGAHIPRNLRRDAKLFLEPLVPYHQIINQILILRRRLIRLTPAAIDHLEAARLYQGPQLLLCVGRLPVVPHLEEHDVGEGEFALRGLLHFGHNGVEDHAYARKILQVVRAAVVVID